MGQNNIESGIASEDNATVTVGANGSLVITDSLGNAIATGTLAAIADTPYIDDGRRTPCRIRWTRCSPSRTTDTSEQDVFVTFPGKAVIFFKLQDRAAAGAERNLRIFLRSWAEVKRHPAFGLWLPDSILGSQRTEAGSPLLGIG